MKYKLGSIVICGMLVTTGASCGFKSDLYLPGQQQKIEQYDSRSLKDLGDEKLRQLQKQNDESESNPVLNEESGVTEPESVETQSIEPASDTSSDAPTLLSDDGVVVDLPTDYEIAREKAKIRQISE